MSMKSYDTSVFVGRLEPPTNGHTRIINKSMSLADRTLILFGSAQESGTRRNPFDVSVRIKLVEEIFEEELLRGRLILAPISDMTNENDIPEDGAWGRYVLDHTKRYLYKIPDMMIYGNDDSRSRWFDLNDIKTIDEHIISRFMDNISATLSRDLLVYDLRDEWNAISPVRIHKYYGWLREMILAVEYYFQESLKKENREQVRRIFYDTVRSNKN